ncbi:hypothetical protein [Glycomyces sp. NPDC047010]|uniref:hypothetical protein n=1 Tax=Glycomyces sp. NPDC047010 TaxID=3155023 RepID=UPI0033F1B7E6
MHQHDDPATMLRRARPDTDAEDAPLDLDAVFKAGYRARRRSRALVGGGATAAVAGLAAVLVLSLGGAPAPQEYPAGDGFDFDPATAGYSGPAPDVWDQRQPALDESLRDAFGGLAVDSGFLDEGRLDYDRPSDDEIRAAMDEGAGYYSALSELGYHDLPLQFGPWNDTGNSGQVYLRGLIARDGDEEAEQTSFTVNALAPGGWTAEPGPTGDVAFPQHLISDEASWTGDAPEFTTEELDDGRTLMTADHGCALEAAVVYPNGSALRSSWDLDCEGQGREMAVEDLRDAMLAMPQIEYDTSELVPVDELLDIPAGWPYDEAWPGAARDDMQASMDAIAEVLDAAYPGVELRSADAVQRGIMSGPVRRDYDGTFALPLADDAGYAVTANVVYTLPGGWLPGLPPPTTGSDPYLLSCDDGDDKDDICEETEVDGRTVATRVFDIGDSHSYWVAVFDPDGWAVTFSTNFEGEIDGYGLEDVIELAAALPAPVYDPAEYDR